MQSCEPPAALNVLLWPVVTPKNRVGEFAAFSFVFAFQYIGQTLDTPSENGGCGYDFASGVHKYLYGEDNPVNDSDPSGNDVEAAGFNVGDNFNVNVNVGLVGALSSVPDATLGPGGSLDVKAVHQGEAIPFQNGTVTIHAYNPEPSDRKHDNGDTVGAHICMIPEIGGPDSSPFYEWRQYIDSNDPLNPLKHHLDVPDATTPGTRTRRRGRLTLICCHQ